MSQHISHEDEDEDIYLKWSTYCKIKIKMPQKTSYYPKELMARDKKPKNIIITVKWTLFRDKFITCLLVIKQIIFNALQNSITCVNSALQEKQQMLYKHNILSVFP